MKLNRSHCKMVNQSGMMHYHALYVHWSVNVFLSEGITLFKDILEISRLFLDHVMFGRFHETRSVNSGKICIFNILFCLWFLRLSSFKTLCRIMFKDPCNNIQTLFNANEIAWSVVYFSVDNLSSGTQQKEFSSWKKIKANNVAVCNADGSLFSLSKFSLSLL